MVRLNRIYTRTGDDGTTGLVDGSRVSKDDAQVEAYGCVDELGATLGQVLAAVAGAPFDGAERVGTFLAGVQQDLFDAGSLLATPPDADLELPQITADHVAALEAELDALNAELPALKSFVLAGGHPAAASLHVARTVCRRAERRCVSLHSEHEPIARVIRYLNRLSDLLFVMARWVNARSGTEEVLWVPGGGATRAK